MEGDPGARVEDEVPAHGLPGGLPAQTWARGHCCSQGDAGTVRPTWLPPESLLREPLWGALEGGRLGAGAGPARTCLAPAGAMAAGTPP